jgi:NAD(P)-dependent dehydrogenase (short-subunit alcohol dehydrogenase family)
MLAGKVAVVTGAGRGIGRGEALELAREGAAVVVSDLDEGAAQAVVDEIHALGGQAVSEIGDVSDVPVADALIARAVDEFGGLDALVNNAGILRDRTVVRMLPQEWDEVIQVHLRGHFAPTRAACTWWKEQDRAGRIVCTTSTSGLLGMFGQANYGAAKAGIAAFSGIVALEMARVGVTCNAIAPAARTRLTGGALPVPKDGSFDFWDADNVAPFVVFLCSDQAAHISGKVFGVQGDAVEIYQPYVSAHTIENGGARWSPTQFAAAASELFSVSGIPAEVENPLDKTRYTVST